MDWAIHSAKCFPQLRVECLPPRGQAVGLWCLRHVGALAWRRGPVCACTRVCWCRRIFTYIHTYPQLRADGLERTRLLKFEEEHPQFSWQRPTFTQYHEIITAGVALAGRL